jgi:threonine/homoserine/homoserine lactone efflux protein
VAGSLTAVGLNIGTLLHTVAVALGLSTILGTSALAFAIVKYLGATYLLYLGLRALLARTQVPSAAASDSATTRSVLFQAVGSGLLNPKVALFFLAFLPQFVNPSQGHLFLQFIVLGGTMAMLDMFYELALVVAFSWLRSRVLGNGAITKWQTRVSGVVLVALGVKLAVQSR